MKEFQKGKAYIVEFWATWCGPCRVSIPHLNDIHNQFKDKCLIVIGQDCWERDETLVAPFVKKMGDKMTYRVALDDKAGEEEGAMAKTWMAAADRNGIPSAFLVDTQGRIAWIDHPMQLKEQVIEDVLAGKFDVRKDEAQLQNQLAWQIVTDAQIEQRDLELAQTIATRANDAAKSKDPNILDTLARIGLYQGLVHATSLRATFMVIWEAGLLPWVVFIGFMVGWGTAQRHFRSLPNPSSHSAFAAWAGAHLLVSALFLAHASWRLHRNFRSLAAPSAGAAWWKRWLPAPSGMPLAPCRRAD